MAQGLKEGWRSLWMGQGGVALSEQISSRNQAAGGFFPPACSPLVEGLTPCGLRRINFVLTPLEAGLQADPCLFIREKDRLQGLKIET